jgi:hypothetical protein
MTGNSATAPARSPYTTALIVILNHRYEANIPRLRAIYGPRFKSVHFLCPFFRGRDADVSAVYDSSSRFQNYLVQARKDYMRAGVTHYAFAADDLILNPAVNEHNLVDRLGLNEHTAFIKEVCPPSARTFEYPHLLPALHAIGGNPFVHHRPELPDREEALRILKRHGIELGFFSLRNLRGHGNRWVQYPGLRQAVALVIRHRINKLVQVVRGQTPRPSVPSYPMVTGYSDFIVVPAGAMDAFLHYCGVLAAINLFVEFAIPTALLFACPSVRTFKDIADLKAGDFWGSEKDRIAQQHNYTLDELLRNFPPDLLYCHPVKLSQWK